MAEAAEDEAPVYTTSAEALLEAIRHGSNDAAAAAIASANPNALASNGESPLVAAVETGRCALLAQLLARGANADAQSEGGASALSVAAMTGNLDSVQQLLAAGATVDLQCGSARSTALIHASQEGHRVVCQALLEAGADSRLRDAYGSSALDYTEQREDVTTFRNFEYQQWVEKTAAQADKIAATPPPPRSAYPLNLKAEVKHCHEGRLPTHLIWQPAEWVHQKQPPCSAVKDSRKGLAFSASGYGVVAPTVAPEESVLNGEEMADKARALSLTDEHALHRKIAYERTMRNPSVFNDDLAIAHTFVKEAVTSQGAAHSRQLLQEAKILLSNSEWEWMPDGQNVTGRFKLGPLLADACNVAKQPPALVPAEPRLEVEGSGSFEGWSKWFVREVSAAHNPDASRLAAVTHYATVACEGSGEGGGEDGGGNGKQLLLTTRLGGNPTDELCEIGADGVRRPGRAVRVRTLDDPSQTHMAVRRSGMPLYLNMGQQQEHALPRPRNDTEKVFRSYHEDYFLTAATSLVPELGAPPEESLLQMLRRPKVELEPEAPAEEPPPDPKAKGKKK